MLNLNHLRVFYEAAKNMSYTKAAKKLFITQPAVSTQIRLLEDSLNLHLFKKKGRSIQLTEEGRTIFKYARRIFEWEKEIENVISEMNQLKVGNLRLGTTKTYARYFMPLLIHSFRTRYPGIIIHLDEGSSLDMIQSLIELKNEVAIIAKVEDNPSVNFIPFSHEELVLILPPSHRLARRNEISIKEIAQEPVIMKENGSGTRKMVNALFKRNGINPEILMETSNTEFIKELVGRGDGISFLVKEAVLMEIKEGKLSSATLKEGRMSLDISIAYLKDQPLSRPAQAFLKILNEIAPAKNKRDDGIRKIMARMLKEWK